MEKTAHLAKELLDQEWLTETIARAANENELENILISINDSIPQHKLKLDLSDIDFKQLYTLTRRPKTATLTFP